MLASWLKLAAATTHCVSCPINYLGLDAINMSRLNQIWKLCKLLSKILKIYDNKKIYDKFKDYVIINLLSFER